VKIILLLTLILVSGCVSIDRTGIVLDGKSTTMPQIIDWNREIPTLQNSPEWWLKEASMRFKDPIIFTCHGGYHWFGTEKVWCVFPAPPRQMQPVYGLANTLANLYPNRDIILVTCNADGDLVGIGTLYTKRVWYMPDGVVWMEPDWRGPLAKWYRPFWKGKGTGSIWDFVSYDGRQLPPATAPTTVPTTAPTTRP
jgi:hypothetical protein